MKTKKAIFIVSLAFFMVQVPAWSATDPCQGQASGARALCSAFLNAKHCDDSTLQKGSNISCRVLRDKFWWKTRTDVLDLSPDNGANSNFCPTGCYTAMLKYFTPSYIANFDNNVCQIDDQGIFIYVTWSSNGFGSYLADQILAFYPGQLLINEPSNSAAQFCDYNNIHQVQDCLDIGADIHNSPAVECSLQ